MIARSPRERGEGKLGCIFGLVLFAFAILIAVKMVPVKVKASELRGVITEESRSAGQRKDPVIRKTILEKAEELELPLDDDGLIIVRGGNEIRIEVHYTVPIEFPGYTHIWNFDYTVENPIF